MSPLDIERWRAHHNIEPFPWEQICWAIAQLTAVIDNRLPGPARVGKSASDFYLRWVPITKRGATPVAIGTGRRAAPPQQDPAEVHAIMSNIFGAPKAS